MSEGGIYPWKVQKRDGTIYGDYEEIFRPLPHPPEGKVWKKVHVEEVDGAMTKWELVDVEVVAQDTEGVEGAQDDQEEEVRKKAWEQLGYVEHTVLPTDTMAGLQIRYKITAAELRKHNDFFGDRFQLCRTLRIPIKGREEILAKNAQRPTKEVIRQRFRNLTECKDEEEITYYLEFHKMNLHEAVCSYQSDTRWEADHFAKRVVATRAAAPPAPVVSTSTYSPSRGYNYKTVVDRRGPPPSYGSVMQSLAKMRARANPVYDLSPIRMTNFVAASPPKSPTTQYHYFASSHGADEEEEGESLIKGAERAPLLGQAVRYV